MEKTSLVTGEHLHQKSPSSVFSVQNGSASFFKAVIQTKLTVNPPNDEYEQEADSLADKVMRIPDSNTDHNFFFKPATSTQGKGVPGNSLTIHHTNNTRLALSPDTDPEELKIELKDLGQDPLKLLKFLVTFTLFFNDSTSIPANVFQHLFDERDVKDIKLALALLNKVPNIKDALGAFSDPVSWFFSSDIVTRASILQILSDIGDVKLALNLLDQTPKMIDIVDVLRIRHLSRSYGNASNATFFENLYQASLTGTGVSTRLSLALNAVRNLTLSITEYLTLAKLSQDDQNGIFNFLNIRNKNADPVLYGFGGPTDWRNFLSKATDPQAAPVTSGSAQAGTVEYIERTRMNIPLRSEIKQADKGKFVSYGGSRETDKNPAPSQLEQETDKQRNGFNRLVWDELKGEGSNSALATHKDTGLILGHGFISGKGGEGQLTEVIQRFLSADIASRNELLDAGISVENNNWMVVNTKEEKKYGLVEEGTAALNLIKFDERLLSLMILISEDFNHAQKLADAQFAQLQKPQHALGITPKQLEILNTGNWLNNPQFIQFAAHCVHRGQPGWNEFLSIPPEKVSSKELVKLFGSKIAKDQPTADNDKKIYTNTMGARFVSGDATSEMMGMALSKSTKTPLAATVLRSSAPLPDKMKTSSGSSNTYTGHIFFRDNTNQSAQITNYFHLEP